MKIDFWIKRSLLAISIMAPYATATATPTTTYLCIMPYALTGTTTTVKCINPANYPPSNSDTLFYIKEKQQYASYGVQYVDGVDPWADRIVKVGCVIQSVTLDSNGNKTMTTIPATMTAHDAVQSTGGGNPILEPPVEPDGVGYYYFNTATSTRHVYAVSITCQAPPSSPTKISQVQAKINEATAGKPHTG